MTPGRLVLLFLAALLISGCGQPVPPTPTAIPPTVAAATQAPALTTSAPTVAPSVAASVTPQPATATAVPSATPQPPTPTAIPSATPQPATATSIPPTAVPQPTAPPTAMRLAGVMRVKIHLIAIGDQGTAGPEIGCGDSVVAVEREIARTQAPLRAAFTELLSLHDQFYGESGLYNALYQSRLTVESVVLSPEGQATVRLTGQVMLGGVCDNPRVQAQFTETARQFPTVRSVTVLINGRDLTDVLSLK